MYLSNAEMEVKEFKDTDKNTDQGRGIYFYDKKIIKAADFAILELAKFHWRRLYNSV